MVLNLVREISAQGINVDLLLIKGDIDPLSVPDNVTVMPFRSGRTYGSLSELVRYLRHHSPQALIAAKHRAIQVAVAARWLSRQPFTLVGRLGTNVSAALSGKHPLRLWFWRKNVQWFYPRLDTLVAVSEGVADDVRSMSDSVNVRVIHNPVITPELFDLASAAAPHPWLTDTAIPVIISVGRLTRQKDFTTLIRAFAKVRAEKACRLLILGEGSERDALTKLAHELGVSEAVCLAGYQTNPYCYIARASVFVLSSRWEGSPNVLTEALALGVPSVATDCPSGPSELLDHGRYGALVPVAEVDALAKGIVQTLKQPLAKQILQAAVSDYTAQHSAQAYLDACGIEIGND